MKTIFNKAAFMNRFLVSRAPWVGPWFLGLIPWSAYGAHPLDTDDPQTVAPGHLEIEVSAGGALPRFSSHTGFTTAWALRSGLWSRCDVGASFAIESIASRTPARPTPVELDLKWRIFDREAWAAGLRAGWISPDPGSGGSTADMRMLLSWSGTGQTIVLNAGRQIGDSDTASSHACWCLGAAALTPVGRSFSMAWEVSVHRPDVVPGRDVSPAAGLVWAISDATSLSAGARAETTRHDATRWTWSFGLTRVF